jgi:hypothetical protein
MQTASNEDLTQASVQADLVHGVMEPVPLGFGNGSYGNGGEGQVAVLVELLR